MDVSCGIIWRNQGKALRTGPHTDRLREFKDWAAEQPSALVLEETLSSKFGYKLADCDCLHRWLVGIPNVDFKIYAVGATLKVVSPKRKGR